MRKLCHQKKLSKEKNPNANLLPSADIKFHFIFHLVVSFQTHGAVLGRLLLLLKSRKILFGLVRKVWKSANHFLNSEQRNEAIVNKIRTQNVHGLRGPQLLKRIILY